MKNNKKSPLTIARQLAFKQSEPELAILLGSTPQNAFTGELEAIASLSRELIGIDTPEMKQSRIAMEATAQGYRENYAPGEVNYTKRIHPRTGVEYLESDRGDASACLVHRPGQIADCDIEETDKSLIATASHCGQSGNDNDDKPEIESLD